MRRTKLEIRLPAHLVREIKADAKRNGMTLDEEIEYGLSRWLTKREQDDRAMQIIRDAAALLDARASHPTPADTRQDASAYEDVHPEIGGKP